MPCLPKTAWPPTFEYFTDILGGNITAEQYGNPNGDGRIKIIDVDPEIPVDPTPGEPDTPDEPTDDTCDHMCHKTGFVGFIWKIVQFFWKLFRMNPVCECGVAHY